MSIKHALITGLLVVSGLALVVPSATGARELDGATVFQDNCGRCHQPRTPGDLSPTGWRAVSFHMRVKANLTPAEFRALEAFLVPAEQASGGTGAPVKSHSLITETCLLCHDATRIQDAVDAGRSEADWAASLSRMRTYGAQIDADQAADLARWLGTEAPKRSP